MRAAPFAILLSAAAPVFGQPVPPLNSKPAAPTPRPDRIPAAQDRPYPGTIQLDVDAGDVTRGIFHVRESIPVAAAGDLVLLYPKWLPGTHSAEGQIDKVAGIRFSGGGRALDWSRDPADVYAFHVAVPAGIASVDAEFDYVSPTAGDQGRIVATPDMASIEWVSTALYPAGYYVRGIPVQASVTVPAGWKVAGAMRPSGPPVGNRTNYGVTSFEILADSPLIAGAHYRAIPLSRDVTLDVIADNEHELEAKPAQIDAHRRLVDQAVKLFGAQHYDHYDFLLTISDNLGGEGLEHHRSSEDGVDRGYFTKWDKALRDRNLLPHEFTHSWDGKYRRPADLWTPDYRTAMEDSLLWVYEGQTQFWGYVLGARSGMLSKQDTLDALAATAATYNNTPGREWRPLADTTNDPIIAQRAPQPWRSWQRSEDYYSEGQLIWIDVDRIIRERSGGRRSIDDFARAFYGMRDRDYGELTYNFADVVATLNRVQPYDWAGYLNRKVNRIAPDAPLEGITQGGYQLIYTDEPTDWIKSVDEARKSTDLSYSGGLTFDKDGKVTGVIWNGAAFRAGLTVGTQLVAVNGRTFDGDALKQAIKDSRGTAPALNLLTKAGDLYRTVTLDWHGGLRYPRLEKTGRGTGTLDALLAPRR